MSVRDIAIGRYIHRDSFLHGLDPRTKFFSIILIMSGVFFENNIYAFLALGCFSLLTVFFSGIKLTYFIKTILPFKWLIIMTFALNILFTGGHIIFSVPLPYGGITSEGLNFGLINSFRIVLVVMFASILTLTTEPVALIESVSGLLRKLPGPLGRHSELGLAMIIALRFIPILIDTSVTIKKSLISRGLNPDSGIKQKLKAVPFFLVPLFVSAVKRADALAVAMDSRLYVPGNARTSLYRPEMKIRDWLIIMLSLILLVLMAI